MPLDEDDDRMQMLASEDDQATSTLLPSSRTQHGLTKSEIVQGMANRFMYSKFYIGLYLGLAILSFVSIVMVSYSIINFAMIIEVATRLLALGRRYWKSVWNIVDVILVGLCAVTLIVLTTGCSVGERSEAIFDTVLLVIRNGFQLFRLFMMLRKNQYSLNARSTRVDFDDIPDVEREPSLEFTALDRDRGLDESFLDDEDSDMEQGRL
ncbi:hypothetical protein [Parasitella parasitica]|uniref:Polycystin cation channel PKD1/PKD2 domain-containing protein n=1 Tax=Parasitella parasitica TaxID=35722 RepID=A0A0B7NTQ9_9FUNG|nr:hypothetical protein [Parasitella parasitica]